MQKIKVFRLQNEYRVQQILESSLIFYKVQIIEI